MTLRIQSNRLKIQVAEAPIPEIPSHPHPEKIESGQGHESGRGHAAHPQDEKNINIPDTSTRLWGNQLENLVKKKVKKDKKKISDSEKHRSMDEEADETLSDASVVVSTPSPPR